MSLERIPVVVLLGSCVVGVEKPEQLLLLAVVLLYTPLSISCHQSLPQSASCSSWIDQTEIQART